MSVKSDKALEEELKASPFFENLDTYERQWFFAQNAPGYKGEAPQQDFRDAAYNDILDVAGELGIAEMEEVLADERPSPTGHVLQRRFQPVR